MEENNYSVIAFYFLDGIEEPHALVKAHKEYFENKDIKSRIYISKEGINAQMSAEKSAGQAYLNWLGDQDPRFKNIHFKIDPYHEHVFPRQCVKFREQLVGFDIDWDLQKGGEHVSPEKWKEMIESGEEYLFLDVRNDYEYDVGHFEGSKKIPCKTFREFPAYIKELKQTHDPKKKVMMCCTGGIRCEIFSAYMKEEGFEDVYQLDGGIINYGHKEGSKHWKGKLFVFDDRMCVPISRNEESEPIGTCHKCGTVAEHYFNCANMDCNKLYLSCEGCLNELKGCCSSACQKAPRLRPLNEQNPHKPFQKWYYYSKEKTPFEA